MIQRGSRTTSLLGSSLNSSQLSLYSHASSRSGADILGRAARVSSGGQASKAVSGHGYLTSSRTVSAPTGAQSKSQKGAISRARERRKEERRRRAHTAADEESLSGGDTGAKNDDLESYLMSFSGEKEGRLAGLKENVKRESRRVQGRGAASKGKSMLPRGSDLDWDKLLETGELMDEVQSEDDDVFGDSIESDLDGSAFLKRTTEMDLATSGPHGGEKAKDKLRKISNVSADIKFLGENSSSPSVSDLVLTDSLDTLSSTAHTPMATEQPRQPHTRNLLSDSDHGLERNALNDTNLIPNEIIDVVTARSQGKTVPVTMITNGATPRAESSSATISEEPSISESLDIKANVLSSIDQLEADINELHHQSDESSFEHNLHDVHSLRELEELLEHPPPSRHSDKDTRKSSINQGKGEDNLTIKSSTSTKQEQSPAQPKPRPSSFKFSATGTTVEDVPDKQYKNLIAVSYSSDEFESESVSEVESVVTDHETDDSVEEESVITQSSGGDMAETVASGDSNDDDDDGTEERRGDVDTVEHSELSYSGFSEAEQIDKSELTESQQQMEQLHVVSDASSSHPHSTSNKDHHVMSTTCKPSATMAGASVHRDACVQTEPLATVSSGSSQPALTGYPGVTVGYHYGKEYLDPSPILPHVISPDALEVVTGYSPSVVALTDMLRTQLSITKSLVAHTRQLTATVSNSIAPNYHYTTLEETKQYIARHRPKLLSFEEARKLVRSDHQ